MMNRIGFSAVACLLLAGCAAQAVDVAMLPPNLYGAGVNVEQAALLHTRLVFSGNAARPTNAADGARLVAEVEYVSGVLNTVSRPPDMPGIAMAQLLQARAETRAAVGVTPTAPSQAVVDALVKVSQTSDPAAQAQAVTLPIFTLGPQATLARLAALPELPETRRAILASGSFGYRYH